MEGKRDGNGGKTFPFPTNAHTRVAQSRAELCLRGPDESVHGEAEKLIPPLGGARRVPVSVPPAGDKAEGPGCLSEASQPADKTKGNGDS
uniref:Uncharacterized protein n=1 Tax=Aegilops tauschii TaxID=37682 RepID=M8BT16_AEGTA